MLSPKINYKRLTLADFSPKMREAIISLRLEDLESSDEELYDDYLLDQGKISHAEHITRAVKRAKS